MLRRDDAIFVEHDSPLVHTLTKRELVLGGALFVVLALAGLITREAFLVCLGIYACATVVAGAGLTWLLRQGALRYGAALPPGPQLIMALCGYLSAVALPLACIAYFLSSEVISSAGPAPDFARNLNTFGALASALLPPVDLLVRIWAIKAAQVRKARTSSDESTLTQVATLERLAYQDALTGLANRRCFEESLTQAGAEAQDFAVMFVDFDKFKPINDTHGHAVGDEFLKAIAKRIESLVRSSALVARLGGDEFAVLIKGNDAQSASKHLAERFTQAMHEPVNCTEVVLRSSASVGIAVGRGGIDEVSRVVHQADMAMYQAKRRGGACYCVADTSPALMNRPGFRGDSLG